MRILGVDVLSTRPAFSPVPGRAQAWVVPAAVTADGAAAVGGVDAGFIVHVRFIDEDGELAQHAFSVDADPFAVARGSSVIAILASHPNDVRSAIASYRVLGWSPIAEAPATDFTRFGYALCLLSSHPSRA